MRGLFTNKCTCCKSFGISFGKVDGNSSFKLRILGQFNNKTILIFNPELKNVVISASMGNIDLVVWLVEKKVFSVPASDDTFVSFPQEFSSSHGELNCILYLGQCQVEPSLASTSIVCVVLSLYN